MKTISRNSFGVKTTLGVGERTYSYFRLAELERRGWPQVGRLPVSHKILLENMLRHEDGRIVSAEDIEAFLTHPQSRTRALAEIPLMPARVLLQDFTGVPVVVDLATMRDAVGRLGGDPKRINPLIPSDLIIDHSIQVDAFGSPKALQINEELEYARNRERYSLLRWAQRAFTNFTVVPPGRGICHQVNLEYLATVVRVSTEDDQAMAYPDTLLGTDSHTTMINGLGVLGWGVGGIEAEAVMLGQPYYLPVPEVLGVRFIGALQPGVTGTDLVLHVTQQLRQRNVVGKFVEFFGPGLSALSLPDRATIANMAPEYGATMGYCPIDAETIKFLTLTGRPEPLVQLVEAYAKEQGMTAGGDEPLFADTLTIDLEGIEANLAGPKRPHDRVPVKRAGAMFREALGKPVSEWGFGLPEAEREKCTPLTIAGESVQIGHGAVVIASITSCTNTSNPALMFAAGLLARNALERGVRAKPWVKTSLAPGSRVVTDYLREAGLTVPLSTQGFDVVGYGCMTCIGNSGPLPLPIQEAIQTGDLVVASVLSGNRNFEGRIHGQVRANYLASPPLVVAYALAGRIDIDFDREPLGTDAAGEPVFLKEIWPSNAAIAELLEKHLRESFYEKSYRDIYQGGPVWESLAVPEGGIYRWDARSTYIQRAPFFEHLSMEVPEIADIIGARVLLLLGDSITTDHISPAGAIPPESPAGRYLQSLGVAPVDFNSYGSRRGNHEVMVRGTFANIRIRNRLCEGTLGGVTRHFPDGVQMSIWEASQRYREEGVPLVVIAGKEYGSGSSRDWAAKGTLLLGVKVVIAESFERIHRGNLIGMGVLPLQFPAGISAEALGLTGEETFSFRGLAASLPRLREIDVEALAPDGRTTTFTVVNRLDTPIELEYYRNGGILPKVLRDLSR